LGWSPELERGRDDEDAEEDAEDDWGWWICVDEVVWEPPPVPVPMLLEDL